jgi:flagellar hook protein FlgE
LTGNLSAGATTTTAPYVRSIKTYDSLGNAQNVTLSFTRQASGNAWNWTASGDAGAAGTGTISFDASGNTSAATGAIALTPTNGAAPQTITPDFSRLTQVAGDSNAAPSDQNGYPPGTLQSFGVDPTGLITGIFSNGMTRPLGQVAVTGFANPEGLSRSGGNEFQATINSGLPQVGTATQGGLGKISTGYLEQSNVDLSNEFTNMIVTQRGFQANTKIVTTVDEMLNDVIHLKQ